MSLRPAHRARRLASTLRARPPSGEDLEWVTTLLSEHELRLFERMPVVDRNLARIAVYELLYLPEIDDPVAITEAVELAKQMSTDDSPRFLNGILGRIAEFATR